MNLLGTLVGGAMEYLSMIFGISAMNLIALGLYLAAFYFTHKDEKTEGTMEEKEKQHEAD